MDILKVKQLNESILLNTNKDIEDWHYNIIDYGKIYAILLTNEKTLFSFYLFGFRKDDFKDFIENIRQNIFKMMLNMKFEQKQFEVILESMENIKFLKTDNRKILASMNQMLIYIHHSMEVEKDLLDINIGLNNLPNSKLDFKKPREQFELLLKNYV